MIMPKQTAKSVLSLLHFLEVTHKKKHPNSSRTHPQGVIVDDHQSKLVPFVNLVFCSDKHLNHLLGYVQSIRFRPRLKNSQIRR